MAKKKKHGSTDALSEAEKAHEEGLAEAASQDPKEYTSEWIAEEDDKGPEQVAEPIHDHPKFHKFKKPLGGEN